MQMESLVMEGAAQTASNAPKRVGFHCHYEGIIEACARLDIKTMPELWRRYCAAANKLFADRLISREALEKFTSKKHMSALGCLVSGDRYHTAFISPWDEGKKAYTLGAIVLGAALERHPRYLFGAPGELAARLERPHARPTPQRVHIRALMRRTVNPLTGKQGLRDQDVRELASTPALRNQKLLTVYLDDRSARYRSSAFDSATGEPEAWATDMATLLDDRVENVFKYEAEQIIKHGNETRERQNDCRDDGYYLYSTKRLPLYRPAPLENAQNAPDESPYNNPGALHDDAHVKNDIDAALSSLPAKIEKILRLRYGLDGGDGMEAKDIADALRVNRSFINNMIAKGLRLLRQREIERETGRPEDLSKIDAERKKIQAKIDGLSERGYLNASSRTLTEKRRLELLGKMATLNQVASKIAKTASSSSRPPAVRGPALRPLLLEIAP